MKLGAVLHGRQACARLKRRDTVGVLGVGANPDGMEAKGWLQESLNCLSIWNLGSSLEDDYILDLALSLAFLESASSSSRMGLSLSKP